MHQPLRNLITIEKYLQKHYDHRQVVDLNHDGNMFKAVIQHNYPQVVPENNPALIQRLEQQFEPVGYRNSLSNLEVLVGLNQLIEKLTDQTKVSTDAHFNYLAITRLSTLGTQVVNTQQTHPDASLVYHDLKLWKLIRGHQPLKRMRQIPKAIAVMRYMDVLNNVHQSIDHWQTFHDRYQPFWYVAEQRPQANFNVDQFGNYLNEWQTMDSAVEFVTGNTKIKAIFDMLKQIDEPGEIEINTAMVDQIQDQQNQAGYQLLYNNEAMDADMMTTDLIKPWANADVKQFLENTI